MYAKPTQYCEKDISLPGRIILFFAYKLNLIKMQIPFL